MFTKLSSLKNFLARNWWRSYPHAAAINDVCSQWKHDDEVLTEIFFERMRSSTPTKILISITTHNRSESCLHVINKLSESIRCSEISLSEVIVLVFNDESDADYAVTKSEAEAKLKHQLVWLNSCKTQGKRNFWNTHQLSFLAAKYISPKYYLSLQDDLDFESNFLENLFDQWEKLSCDKGPKAIYLYSEDEIPLADRNGRWIRFSPEQTPAKNILKIQWLDLQGYFCDLSFLNHLEFKIYPIPASWWRFRPSRSSGVGRQITVRSFGHANIYQPYPALITHGHVSSVMNPKARSRRPLDNRSTSSNS
ncbi:MAG: hypothetical protein AAF353_05125 [Pseudomonadota bacterium]